jgi:FKBP-type peptidyl-prolyl cis-trans isomerase
MRAKIVLAGIFTAGIAATAIAAARHQGAKGTPPLDAQRDGGSYAMGVEMARNVQRLGVSVDADAVVQGVRDALAGTTLRMSEEELRASLVAVKGDWAKKRAETAEAAAEARKTKEKEFLVENAKKEGVVTLPSGLQYKIIQAGNGRTPTDGDTVVAHYRGTLVDGTEFDSSIRRGVPATLHLARVIPGWKEALMLMPVGSKWQLFIPPELAYGKRGAGRKIGPNATLVFDVELLAIGDAKAKPASTKEAGTNAGNVKEASAPARHRIQTASRSAPLSTARSMPSSPAP